MPFDRCVATVISVDPTFTNGRSRKGKKAGDFVAMEVWGVSLGSRGEVGLYCYYSEEVRRGFNETVQSIVAMRRAWRTSFVLVELAASGEPIVQELERMGMVGVIGISPNGGAESPIGKEAKAKVASAYIKAGLVHFLADAPWYERKARNLVRFPNGPHDDDVDTTSQALIYLMTEFGFSGGWMQAVGGWKDELRTMGSSAQDPKIIDTEGSPVLPMLENWTDGT